MKNEQDISPLTDSEGLWSLLKVGLFYHFDFFPLSFLLNTGASFLRVPVFVKLVLLGGIAFSQAFQRGRCLRI